MEATRVTASEFQQAFGALSDKARREPVVITKHGRDSLVVMAAEEWERLRRRNGSRPCKTQACPTCLRNLMTKPCDRPRVIANGASRTPSRVGHPL